jgi:hypothetical protein
LTKKITFGKKFTRDIQTAYGSFGIAWRLLDDIKDIKKDMVEGAKSSVYICLPENLKNLWDKNTENKNSGCAKVILDYVLENSLIDRIKERICSELESAASIADRCNMTGLAGEFRCLLKPLKNRHDRV